MNNLSVKNINLNKNYFELPEDLQYIVASYIPLKKIDGCKIKYEQYTCCKNQVYNHKVSCRRCNNDKSKIKILITLENGSISVFKNYINNIIKIINNKDYVLKNNYGYWNNVKVNKINMLFYSNSNNCKIEKISDKKYVINDFKIPLFISFFNELHPKKSYRLTCSQNYESIIILFDIDDSKIRNQLRCVNKIFNKSIVKKN